MERDIFNREQSQKIMDTILSGHNSYLELRLKMKREMEVSTGFAQTKSNFIDDAFAKAIKSKELDFINRFDLAKAGESWEYLEFRSQTDLGRVLLIVKNLIRLKQTFEKRNNRKQSQYLLDYAQKCRKFLEDNIEQITFDSDLGISDNNSKITTDQFENFFVISYETDENKHIVKVEIDVLDPDSQVVIAVQTLTGFIQSSSVEQLSDDELRSINEIPVSPDSPENFGYVAKEEEGEESV